MKRSSRQIFLLARAYGALAHSYLGANFRELLRLKSLGDLHDLLWPRGREEGAEAVTPAEMEQRIVRSCIDSLESVLDQLDAPPILVHMLRRFEYRNLKSALRGLSEGRVDASRFVDLGRYALLRLRDARDIEKALRASPYAWALTALKSLPREKVENEADRRYYEQLLGLARALPGEDRLGVLRYVTLEVALANAIWALRLRFSYGLDEAAARSLLVGRTGDTTRRACARAFEIPADSIEEWRRWRFGWLLEDQLGESFHAPDPVMAEARMAQRLYVRAHQLLHQHPFSLCPFFASFALKQQEASLLTTAVEGIALGVSEKDLLGLAGIASPASARTAPGGQG